MPVGAGGSRLLRGNHPEHEALEAEAAAFFGSEAALYFATGFAANFAIFSTLPQRGDLVVHDELIHASVHDGMRNGRAERGRRAPQRCRRVRGRDRELARARRHGPAVDRGREPLQHGRRLARRSTIWRRSRGATTRMLVIDEAHATGVLGPDGRGLRRDLEGAADVIIAAHLRQGAGRVPARSCARPRDGARLPGQPRPRVRVLDGAVAAAWPPPCVPRCDLAATQPQRRERLAALVAHAGARASRSAAASRPSGTQILPVDRSARTRARWRSPSALQAAGLRRARASARRRCRRAPRGCGSRSRSNVDEAQIVGVWRGRWAQTLVEDCADDRR